MLTCELRRMPPAPVVAFVGVLVLLEAAIAVEGPSCDSCVSDFPDGDRTSAHRAGARSAC